VFSTGDLTTLVLESEVAQSFARQLAMEATFGIGADDVSDIVLSKEEGTRRLHAEHATAALENVLQPHGPGASPLRGAAHSAREPAGSVGSPQQQSTHFSTAALTVLRVRYTITATQPGVSYADLKDALDAAKESGLLDNTARTLAVQLGIPALQTATTQSVDAQEGAVDSGGGGKTDSLPIILGCVLGFFGLLLLLAGFWWCTKEECKLQHSYRWVLCLAFLTLAWSNV
jgi:hypothetical protein